MVINDTNGGNMRHIMHFMMCIYQSRLSRLSIIFGSFVKL